MKAPSSSPASEEAMEVARKKERVRVAIDALPARLREVVVLTEYAELSYEIAATLGIPVGRGRHQHRGSQDDRTEVQTSSPNVAFYWVSSTAWRD